MKLFGQILVSASLFAICIVAGTSARADDGKDRNQANRYLITNYPQPRNDGTNQEHAAVSASLNDGAQQGPVSKGPQ